MKLRISGALAVATLALSFWSSATMAATVAPSFDNCPDESAPGAGRTSAVLSSTLAGSPNNSFNFKVCNTSFNFERREEQGVNWLLRDWELPYDPLGQITEITAPDGWGWAIETIGVANDATGWDGAVPTWFNPSDPFFDARYLGLTQVIHFYTCSAGNADTNPCPEGNDGSPFGDPLRPGEELEGFSFLSPFGVTDAPYQASWVLERPRSGDPDFPIAGAPNTPGLRNVVPEPSGLALAGLGLLALWCGRRGRQLVQAKVQAT
jgi:PEP-CTERM motif